MLPAVSFFNFSLNKVLATERDNFAKARLKIALVMLIYTLVKIVITIPIAIVHHQYIQATRSGIIFILFLAMLKILLYRPNKLRMVAQVVLVTAVGVVWTNLVFVIQQLNILTVQMIVSTVLCAFYLIGKRTAIVYSALAIVPVFIFEIVSRNSNIAVSIPPQQLVSPMYEIVVFMNFLSIAGIHYLFYKAYERSVIEKDQLNAELAIKVAEVKALADSKSMFLSSMSHELRTPLNAVIGITSLLKESAPVAQNENLEILEFSTISLLAMVNDILDYHKSENDKIVLESIPVNLAELLNKIVSTLKLKAAEKNLMLNSFIDEPLKNMRMITDPTRLTQIIYNLAGNAIKFTNKGKVDIQVELIELTDNTARIQFSVKDTGIGIAETKLEEIFEPFTQASADTTRHFGGTGLGLAIVKKLLALFGSAVEVNSEPGKGSEFTFGIEFELATKQVIVPKTQGSVLKMVNLNILIAEDNNINAMLLGKMLAGWQIKTSVAANGQEVIDRLSAEDFNIILMDLQMPLMDGYETARVIRSLTDPLKANIPIIALTASSSKDIYPQITAAGMQDCLSKPYEAIALYEKLERIASTNKAGEKPPVSA